MAKYSQQNIWLLINTYECKKNYSHFIAHHKLL